MIGSGSAEPDCIDSPLTGRGCAVMRDEEDADFLAPMVLWEGIAGWHRLQAQED